jgi:hypothetical protein
VLSVAAIWSVHSGVFSCWIATRTPSAVVEAARAAAVSSSSLTAPSMRTTPSNGATHRRRLSSSGNESIIRSRSWVRSPSSPSVSTWPAAIGTGVSPLMPYTGTPSAPTRPNSTLDPVTRSAIPSPLTSLKYWLVVENVLT